MLRIDMTLADSRILAHVPSGSDCGDWQVTLYDCITGTSCEFVATQNEFTALVAAAISGEDWSDAHRIADDLLSRNGVPTVCRPFP